MRIYSVRRERWAVRALAEVQAGHGVATGFACRTNNARRACGACCDALRLPRMPWGYGQCSHSGAGEHTTMILSTVNSIVSSEFVVVYLPGHLKDRHETLQSFHRGNYGS
ncbi:unnamed protein product [Sphacelaria rigidula]